jgi:hypothetical protein
MIGMTVLSGTRRVPRSQPTTLQRSWGLWPNALVYRQTVDCIIRPTYVVELDCLGTHLGCASGPEGIDLRFDLAFAPQKSNAKNV